MTRELPCEQYGHFIVVVSLLTGFTSTLYVVSIDGTGTLYPLDFGMVKITKSYEKVSVPMLD